MDGQPVSSLETKLALAGVTEGPLLAPDVELLAPVTEQPMRAGVTPALNSALKPLQHAHM